MEEIPIKPPEQKVVKTLRRYLSTRFLQSTSSKVGLGIVVAILLFAIITPHIEPYGPTTIAGAANSPPSLAHPFGTDYLGHDVLSQMAFGSLPTFGVAFLAGIVSVIIGFFAGLLSGYFEKLEGPLGGTTDVFLAFPLVPLLILIGELFVTTNVVMTIVLGILLWPPLTRAVRSEVSSLKKRPYLESAKASGLSDIRIILTIMAPQTIFLAVAYLVINISLGTIVLTALEFLGVGNPNAITLGSILFWAQQYAFVAGDWWWFVAPGLLIALFSVGLGILGLSLEGIVNPRLRRH